MSGGIILKLFFGKNRMGPAILELLQVHVVCGFPQPEMSDLLAGLLRYVSKIFTKHWWHPWSTGDNASSGLCYGCIQSFLPIQDYNKPKVYAIGIWLRSGWKTAASQNNHANEFLMAKWMCFYSKIPGPFLNERMNGLKIATRSACDSHLTGWGIYQWYPQERGASPQRFPGGMGYCLVQGLLGVLRGPKSFLAHSLLSLCIEWLSAWAGQCLGPPGLCPGRPQGAMDGTWM